MFGVDGNLLSRQYKHHISDYHQWVEGRSVEDYVLLKENQGERISMDKTCFSQGELYTIITNKSAKGQKEALIAIIRGTKADLIIAILLSFPLSLRLRVKEITIDLSSTMILIAKKTFLNATIASDRFHVQKLMNEAVSDLRVDYRWQAIEQENDEIQLAKEVNRKFIPHIFRNGDTRRQLLARSRHIVMKHFPKWTKTQQQRAEILFEEYPAIEEAYYISMEQRISITPLKIRV